MRSVIAPPIRPMPIAAPTTVRPAPSALPRLLQPIAEASLAAFATSCRSASICQSPLAYGVARSRHSIGRARRPRPPALPPPLPGPAGPAALAGHPPGYVTTTSRGARAIEGAPRRGALPVVFSLRAGGRGPWAGAQQPGALRPSAAVRPRRVHHPRPVTHRPSPALATAPAPGPGAVGPGPGRNSRVPSAHHPPFDPDVSTTRVLSPTARRPLLQRPRPRPRARGPSPLRLRATPEDPPPNHRHAVPPWPRHEHLHHPHRARHHHGPGPGPGAQGPR